VYNYDQTACSFHKITALDNSNATSYLALHCASNFVLAVMGTRVTVWVEAPSEEVSSTVPTSFEHLHTLALSPGVTATASTTVFPTDLSAESAESDRSTAVLFIGLSSGDVALYEVTKDCISMPHQYAAHTAAVVAIKPISLVAYTTASADGEIKVM
jgi:hypothetical protein